MHVKKIVVLIFLFFTIFVSQITAQDHLLCRISIENVSSHFQARAVRRFAGLIDERSGGALRVEFYDNAQLFRDTDAVRALAVGKVEIIVPGIWQLDRFVPDTAALMLPAVYAQPRSVIRSLVDGVFGEKLSISIENALSAVVIGPWLDLGYGHLFSVSSPIRSIADISGKRIRVAGGRGNEERIRALGGEVVSIPSPDLPSYLTRGLVDGVLSTYETIDTGKLDAQGIRAVLEDNEYYPFYVPLASRIFWEKLSPKLKDMIFRTWNEVVAEARIESEHSQETAKKNLINRGMKVYYPSPSEVAAVRKKLLDKEESIAGLLNLSAGIVELQRTELFKLEGK